MTSEENLIERVRQKFASVGDHDARSPASKGSGVRLGIGDDAAVLRPGSCTELVVTTDAFLENVHFVRSTNLPDSVGYKALARATSDLAAMGARPRHFLLSLALPEACTGKWLDGFLNGMARAARNFGLTLIGGDTTKYSTVMVNLTVMGEVPAGRAILRSGARAGDLIYVSGRLGESELGWQLLKRGLHKRTGWKQLMKKHLHPEPRLDLGRWLAERGFASAMIDTSDGFSTDLAHICKASDVGAKVFAEKIPMPNVPTELRRLRLDPMRLALDGGEDYELLFTVPKKLAGRLAKKVSGLPLTMIGEITQQQEICLIDSSRPSSPSTVLKSGGWDPFRKQK